MTYETWLPQSDDWQPWIAAAVWVVTSKRIASSWWRLNCVVPEGSLVDQHQLVRVEET
jgi:hypothetical protein